MEADSQERHDEYYLRALTELGDSRRITSTEDIYAQGGLKLVSANVHISSALYERLIRHKLLAPIEKSLTIENILNAEQLLADVHGWLDHNDKLRKIAAFVSQGNSYRQIIADIHLPTPLALKLTVAREQFPHIYQHSLLMMILSVYLARCEGMTLHEEESIATAALLLDIGLLHIDPQLLAPNHVMSSAERRHLYVHPLTAYLMLLEFPELPRHIANAVFEHHEKMDGSGYPRGLHGEKISRAGQILGITVLAARAFDSNNPHVPWKNLDIMLKLNAKQFGPGLIGHLQILHDDTPETQANGTQVVHLFEQVRIVAKLFEEFNRNSTPPPHDPAFEFAQHRLAELRLGLLRAGFDPREPEALLQMFADDPVCIAEFIPVIDEVLWQFKSLLQEISRQWPASQEQNKLENNWLNDMQLLLSAVAPQT